MDGRTEALADQEEEGGDLANSKSMPSKMKVTKSSIVTLLILVFINLLNYMDRYTLSGQLIFRFCQYCSYRQRCNQVCLISNI